MTSQRVGIIIPVQNRPDLFEVAASSGVKRVELNCWNPANYTPELAQSIREEADRLGITITALWAGWPGPTVWDFIDGPLTLGIVPPEWRAVRVSALKKGADFAHALGLPTIITHLGFIPENASDPAFPGVVEAVGEVATHCKTLGLEFFAHWRILAFEDGYVASPHPALVQRLAAGNLEPTAAEPVETLAL